MRALEERESERAGATQARGPASAPSPPAGFLRSALTGKASSASPLPREHASISRCSHVLSVTARADKVSKPRRIGAVTSLCHRGVETFLSATVCDDVVSAPKCAGSIFPST
ncbi:hypothetical protein AAFF_G00285320 [Aldrovandia affinis]|uniref:Uncharacterized protein n=1 Tax=Aldrovandia affinis TaxID=143900 RepID=A0AAD7TAE6_9TELE|nr:hypothetical protein AAFF_G00285320 [Aldrovandia affinis]